MSDALFHFPLPPPVGRSPLMTWTGSRWAAIDLVENLTVPFEAPTVKTYTIIYKSYVPYIVNEANIVTTSGTATLSLQIDGVTIAGMSALAITSTFQNAVATGANILGAGSTLTVVVSAVSSPVDLVIGLKLSR